VHTPFWMATPHHSTEDFVYNGMYIPKDTTVVLNCYDIHHNEERYPDSYEPLSLVDLVIRKMS
jgi:cytochrome P450